jgi:predicted patatin/cPLA2 family phospholipase
MSATEPLISTSKAQDVKRSLILAGGGMRLAYQAGVLMALQESSYRFSHVDGTSGGIFNTAMLTSGLSPYEMADCWRALEMKWFVSMAAAKDYLRPLQMKGYTDADNIRKHVFPDLRINLDTVRKNADVNATFNVCNFSDKSIESISNRNVTEDHLIAGVSLPMVMPALQIGKAWYTDAVWIKDANLLEAVRQQSEELWLVWAIGNCVSYLPGALNQYVHMIEMSANGALLEEYKQIARVNESIRDGKSEHGQRSPVKLFVIKPEFPLPLDPDLFFDKIDTRSLINIGYSDGKRCLSAMTEEGTAMDKAATMMREPGVRFNFRGTFDGTASWSGTPIRVSLYTYFVVQQIDGQYAIRLFSSIRVSKLSREMCLYDQQIRCTRDKQFMSMEAKAKMFNDEKTYDVRLAWTLHSPFDFLIGLEFKRVSITVSCAGTEVMKGTLYQSVRSRLRGCYTSNVRTGSGQAGNIRMRYSLMAKLITDGI